MERKHAIIIIKNNEGKFLQYFDDIWNSYLFLNCKISDEKNKQYIESAISEKFGIKIKNINLIMDKVHSKFSEKDKIVKEYHHYFYNAILDENNFNENIKIKYFSYEELLEDKRIQEVNSDIVKFVGEIDI